MYLTERLKLRPGCREDSTALFRAISDFDIVRNLSSAPWPYTKAAAEALASSKFNPEEPRHFIFLNRSTPEELVGVAGLDRMPGGEMELGYWIAKDHWNRGYAFEAGRKVIEIAKTELKLARIWAGYFIDNPASGRVLGKLGFVRAAGIIERYSLGRRGVASCQMCKLDL